MLGRRPLALLAASVALLAPPAAQAASSVTVSYSAGLQTLTLTGTAESDSMSLNSEGLSPALGGGTGFRVLAGGSTTIVVDPTVPANTCEPSAFASPTLGGVRCKQAGVTQVIINAGDGGDSIDTYDLGATPPALTINGGPGGDLLQGSYAGNDVINGESDPDTIVGRGGNDTINGGGGPDRLIGEGGDDIIDGGDGDENLNAGNNALITGGDGNDTVNGGPGNDWVFGDNDQDIVNGDAGDDRVEGGAGTDALDGGADNDTLDGGDGVDTFVGGTGTADTVSYSTFSPPGGGTSATPGVRVTLDGLANDGPDTNFTTPGIQGSTENVNADVEGITGSSFADELTGAGGNETLNGGSGHDVLDGAGGDDRLDGGGGDEVFTAEPGADTYISGGATTFDTITYAARTTPLAITLDGLANDGALDADPGTAGNQSEHDNVPTGVKVIAGSGADALTGSASGDWFVGGASADTVNAGAGNDLIDAGTGADTVDGQADTDTIDYSARTNAVAVHLADPATDGEAGEGDVLSNIEGVKGGSGNDTLTIGSVPTDASGVTTFRSADGGEGTDTLTGSNGIDTLTGGPGSDTLTGLQGPDRLAGGDGSDTLDGGADGDVIFGDAGTWTSYAYSETGAAPTGEGPDTLIGASGPDTLVGGSGNDALQGGDGDDVLWGGIGADQVSGDAGSDAVNYSSRAAGVTVTSSSGAGDDGNDLDGPAGARDTVDSVERITGSQAADAITGTDANDTLKGLNGDDQLRGRSGDDSLDGGDQGNGGNGADLLDGGTDFDTVTYGGSGGGAASISLDGVQNDGRGDETPGGEKDNVVAIESVIGSAGNDTITGSSADERIDGSGGNDTIDSAGGNDTIIAGNGADTVNGGEGNDLISSAYWDPTTPSWGVADGARDTVNAGPGDDVVIPQDRGAGASSNSFLGGPGDDTLSLTGEIEPSRLSQDGIANDGVINGGGGDSVGEFEILEGGQVADTLTGGGGAVELRGLGGTDTINGSAADELLLGGAGDDTMSGGEGNDALDGEDGKDLMTGGAGLDTATYQRRSTDLKVTLDGLANDGAADTNRALAGNQSEADNVQTEAVIGGDGADQLIGDGTANVLRGSAGNDAVDGGAGDDTVDGGPGSDTLLSGAGTDTLDAADGQADTLTCDVRAGKTIRVDPSLDAFASCAGSAPLGEVIEPSTFAVAPFAQVESLGAPPASAGAGSGPSGQPPRPARELAKAIRTVGGGTARSATGPIRVGSTTCGNGRTCTVSAQLLAGKRAVAAGTRTGTGKIQAQVRLTARGWSLVKRSSSTRLTLVVVMTEGGSQATVRRSFTVRRGGSR